MKGLPLPNSCGGGRAHGLMLLVSAFREPGVLAAVLGDDRLPDSEGRLPKDEMGEESRHRLWVGDAAAVFTVGVVGELIPVLPSVWAEEVIALGTVLSRSTLPVVVARDVDLEGESGEAPGQLEGEAWDVG